MNKDTDKLTHVLYERLIEFYSSKENQERYKRWRDDNEKQKKGT